MRGIRAMLFVAVLGMRIGTGEVCAQNVDLSVSIIAPDPPAEVTIQKEDDIQSIALAHDPDTSVYKCVLARPGPEGGDQLVTPYRLVASWHEVTEQLYLGVRPVSPAKLALKMYHDPIKFDYAGLNAIDALESDLDNTLRKYLRARAFHRKWRFGYTQPFHIAALRSARLWFDGAVALAKWPNSVFRMDSDIATIMNEYEVRATRNKTFERRYRQCVPPGYIRGTEDQLTALDYEFVGRIPALVKAGKLDEARDLNEAALATLSDSPAPVQRVVLTQQRIDVDLLRNNARYIGTLIAEGPSN